MKFSTIILIILFIAALYYYTSETFEVVEIVGKHVFTFVTGMYKDVQQEVEEGTFDTAIHNLKEFLRKLTEMYKKVG